MTRRRALTVCTVWLSLNLVLMWGNSLLPGTISGQVSDWVKALLARLLAGSPVSGSPGSGLIRKAAHFLEFASLGLALSWLWAMQAKSKWLALLCGVAAACVDEGIQRFVPGRCGCLTDVGIDTAGVLFGMALFWIGHKVRKKTKNNKYLEETT